MPQFTLALGFGLILGLLLGLLFGVSAIWPALTTRGVGADTIASALGGAIGAVATVIAVFAIEAYKRRAEAAPHYSAIYLVAADTKLAIQLVTKNLNADNYFSATPKSREQIIKIGGELRKHLETSALLLPEMMTPLRRLVREVDLLADELPAEVSLIWHGAPRPQIQDTCRRAIECSDMVIGLTKSFS